MNNHETESESFLLITNRTPEDAELLIAQDNLTGLTPIALPVDRLFQEYKLRKVGE